VWSSRLLAPVECTISKGAIGLYRALGFRETPPYWTSAVPALYFSKRLDD